jgi:hypothetical protein
MNSSVASSFFIVNRIALPLTVPSIGRRPSVPDSVDPCTVNVSL